MALMLTVDLLREEYDYKCSSFIQNKSVMIEITSIVDTKSRNRLSNE